jgi:hypothetical protein
MAEGVDWAWGRINPADLLAKGYTVALRYFAPPGDHKALSPAEAHADSLAGLWIVTVWEHGAQDAAAGAAAGTAAGRQARAQADACGQPLTAPIYVAVDFDAPPAVWGAIAAFLDAFGAATGRPVGVYSDAALARQMLADGHAHYIWETVAWSHGVVLPNAVIYQRAAQVNVDGVTGDVDDILGADFGGWRTDGSTTAHPQQTHQPITPGAAMAKFNLVSVCLDPKAHAADDAKGRHAFWGVDAKGETFAFNGARAIPSSVKGHTDVVGIAYDAATDQAVVIADDGALDGTEWAASTFAIKPG